MATYFQGNADHPYHISVGAVLQNDRGEVCCNYYKSPQAGYWKECGMSDFYTLMRETLEPGESLESALERGLQEEFGAKGECLTYIGSIQGTFMHRGVSVEKTTLYFLTKLVSQDVITRRKEDAEEGSSIEWHTLDFLIPKMQEQTKRFGRTDVDESAVLERVRGSV